MCLIELTKLGKKEIKKGKGTRTCLVKSGGNLSEKWIRTEGIIGGKQAFGKERNAEEFFIFEPFLEVLKPN